MEANIIQILQEVNIAGEDSKVLKRVSRLTMILLRKLDFSIETIANILNTSRNTVSLWCKRFACDPYAGLTDLVRTGRPKILTDDEEKGLGEFIDSSLEKMSQEVTISGNDIKLFVNEEFKKVCSLSVVYRTINNLGYSYKKPQPVHLKNDKTVMLNWINKFKRDIRKVERNLINKKVEVYFQDETRFGQKTISTKIWAKKDSKVTYLNQNGFLNAWIYGAINPLNGDSHALILPRLDSENMQIFIDSFLEKIPDNKHIIMVLDGSRAHKNGILRISENLTLYFLPPYSPELNPIERLWLFIKKKYLSFKLYDNLNEINEKGAWAWNKISSEMIKSICKCDYLSNLC